jgi:uncharacterized SAM-binding protein YcdF (DUF218 family)
MMRRLGRLLANLFLLLALTAAAITASAIWFALNPPAEPAAVLIVLGGDMEEDHSLGPQTRQRVEAGVALFKAGAAPRIHFTGGSEGAPAAGEQMRDLAVSLGVPASAASVESRSRSTLQNAIFSRPVLGPFAGEPVMLVTDGFHLARAWASFRWAGYRQVGLAAASAFGAPPVPEQLRWLARETLAWWFNLARAAAFDLVTLVRGSAPVEMLR